ncbi:MAG: YchJ family protein [Gammaproteobacteria bacterium]
MENCPCGSGICYSACCGMFIQGDEPAPTPEALMRSRYTAYTLSDINYIARTMKGPAIKNFDKDEAENWAKQVTWLGLKVLQSSVNQQRGFVEFAASYALNQQTRELHELSEFELSEGRWYYVNGINPKQVKVGRNDACSCGSQKKYKKCCGKE